MRRWMLLLLVAVLSLGAPAVGSASATAPPAPSDPPVATTTVPLQTMPPMERDISDCISAVPKPGCGFEPQQAGDRGGWLQWTLFGVMLTGIAFIAWRVVAGARKSASDDA